MVFKQQRNALCPLFGCQMFVMSLIEFILCNLTNERNNNFTGNKDEIMYSELAFTVLRIVFLLIMKVKF